MKAKTLLSIFNGDYSCIERPTSKDKRYTENLSKCISIEENLEKNRKENENNNGFREYKM